MLLVGYWDGGVLALAQVRRPSRVWRSATRKVVQAFSAQKSPSSVRLGQKKLPGFLLAFMDVPWIGQMGAVFFVGSDGAGATGGVAPMAFRRSIIARRESALPSTSTWTGKPSMLAVTVKRAAGVGCLDSMGVTLLVWLVIRASFVCDINEPAECIPF